ncbi:alpha-L-arabinofuranosidase C-terminal domain-containing protein [Chitinophaga sp. XS-30]|uniref:alpha-L-arabinofuranosidase C-terminal domain-containing protein n=1 Tax=Chitinophaga sp. XS-30 TaxID=2604421 RepID=UPI0011DE1852|nr:alpha-L-arabinofuranosidase C-terminal domain-containing protein [Chitinophaga sp. XS-30]QEH43205.1 alpha-L-arabinofuranosidase [Chitinophaga sp. XS-30]
MHNILKLSLALLLAGTTAHAQQLTIEAGKPTATIQPTMWGIFFEDINFAADGGLYAELVKNRSFEFLHPMMGWKTSGKEGSMLIENRYQTHPENPRFATIRVNGSFGIVNEGFRGMGVRQGEQYDFSMLARQADGAPMRVSVYLVNEKNEKIGGATLNKIGYDWKTHRVTFICSQTAEKAKLEILFDGNGVIQADMISLFPQQTWKERPGGLRKDLVQKLADLKPGFVRFPGGCIVEGKDLANRYQWKTTVGDLQQRKVIMNRWNVEFAHRNAPDYFQSFGLGFYEYFQLAEDLGAAPLPILNCGMACQFNSSEVVPLDELDPYIQDALDLIEFANGGENTKWGKLRAEMGHPAPFGLKHLGIGNEQWDRQYFERYQQFEKILKEKHPEILLISGTGPYSDGKMFDDAWAALRKTKADLVDEHYYKHPDWFLRNAKRYDTYDREGAKIFAGEYAAHDKEQPAAESRNSWFSALAEACFMTGLERNADIVHMASYAPLLAHVEAWQWRPDLIWFNNLTSICTPNYYVQQLFSNNTGKQVISILQDGKVIAGEDSLYASATIDREAGKLFVKLVNSAAQPKKIDLRIKGVSAQQEVISTTLHAADLMAYNTIQEPQKVYPEKGMLTGKRGELSLELGAATLQVLEIPVKR